MPTALFSFDRKIAYLTSSRVISILRDDMSSTLTWRRSDRAVPSRNELSYVSPSELLYFYICFHTQFSIPCELPVFL